MTEDHSLLQGENGIILIEPFGKSMRMKLIEKRTSIVNGTPCTMETIEGIINDIGIKNPKKKSLHVKFKDEVGQQLNTVIEVESYKEYNKIEQEDITSCCCIIF